MPLSEDEQRILLQIEQDLYENDPDFAREVGQTTLYRHAFRNIKWAVLGLIAGFVLLVAALGVHFLLAFAGFLVIFVSTIVIERNARKLGRVGLQQVTTSVRASGIRDAMGGFGQKFRTRFQRDDE